MKKAYLLFTLLFSAGTFSLFAQTIYKNNLDKIKLYNVTDTTAILLNPLVIYTYTTGQQVNLLTARNSKSLLNDQLTQDVALKPSPLPDSNNSIHESITMIPAQINIPLLISATSLKHPVQETEININRFNPQITPVTDNDLQVSIIKKINFNLNSLNEQFVAVAKDTIRAAIPQKMLATLSNLKQQIALVSDDSVRASYYQNIADNYLKYDSITIRKTKQIYQEAAIEFTLKALHSYTRGIDGYGIMKSYINLSKIYTDQKKYSQAKWFILQANTRARNLFDVPYTISTLISLANIKMAIKDYSLARRDLDEALTLSIQKHLYKQEALVQQNLAYLFINLDEPKKADAALKRHDMLEDSILKAADAKRLAAMISQDSTIQSKKKLDTLTGKRVTRINSYKRIASL